MSNYNVAPLEVLVEQFERMPGIGHKTAQRLAYYVLNLSKTDAEALAKAVTDAHTKSIIAQSAVILRIKNFVPYVQIPQEISRLFVWLKLPVTPQQSKNTRVQRCVSYFARLNFSA